MKERGNGSLFLNLRPSSLAVKPASAFFREDHGTIFYDKSPRNRKVKTLGRLADKSGDVEYQNTTDKFDENDPHRGDQHYLVNKAITSATGQAGDARVQKEYINPYGFLTKTIAEGPNEIEHLVSTREPDILDRTWKTTSPLGMMTEDVDDDYSTTFNYNTLNQLLETNDPDAGTTRSLYDKQGNLRLFIDGNKSNNFDILVNKYDEFSRLKEVYLVMGLSDVCFLQSNADNPDWPDDKVHQKKLVMEFEYDRAPAQTSLPEGITAGDMNYLKCRLAVAHAYSANGNVSNYFSYDYRGRIKTTWIKIANIPLQKQELTYNFADQVIKKVTGGTKPGNITGGSTKYVKYEKYNYDELNRLSQVWVSYTDENAYERVLEYEYWPDGKVRYKNFGDYCMQSIAYKYDPASRLMEQRHETWHTGLFTWSPSEKYDQFLYYNKQGNISMQYYTLPPDISKNKRAFYYQYDHFNRLALADYGVLQGGRLDFGEDKFDARYKYYKDGNIMVLARGPLTNEDPMFHGVYVYKPETHQLESIENLVANGGKDRSDPHNYVYDANGNIIEDKGLNRKIYYDYRNMPERIEQYTDNTFTALKSTTKFLYDSDGNRVAKFYSEEP